MSASTESVSLARRALHHLRANTTDQAPGTMQLPISAYRDPERYAYEVERVFKRVPLALALTVELPNPGDYRAMTVVGMPVVVVRGDDGEVRTFFNICRHRGAAVCEDGRGRTSRFVCKYHAWRYDLRGRLKAVTDRTKFGDVDLAAHSLVELPCAERRGFVWACLSPGASFDIDVWLGGMGPELDTLQMDRWYLYEQRELTGPGWKVAWDGYLEAYHHPTVHVSTLAQHTVGNLLVHDTYGPHQRLTLARKTLASLADVAEREWDAQAHLRLIHSIFPTTSVSGILGDHCLVTQLFPGPTPEASTTRQTILAAREPVTPEERARTASFSQLALAAVKEEDYAVTSTIQAGLRAPANAVFTLGRNEPGIQHYHRWVERIVADEDPASLPARTDGA